jgi:hypothetical protein
MIFRPAEHLEVPEVFGFRGFSTLTDPAMHNDTNSTCAFSHLLVNSTHDFSHVHIDMTRAGSLFFNEKHFVLLHTHKTPTS